MSPFFSRRSFLALTGGALAAPFFAWAEGAEEDDEVPALLDHIILGSNDLDRGIDLVEEITGVRPALTAVHPGRGTPNALLPLAERPCLEILAPHARPPLSPHHVDPMERRISPTFQGRSRALPHGIS